MHLNAVESVSFADVTLSVSEVETKHGDTEASRLCVVLLSEEFSDFREQVGIGRWIGARRFADRFLVNIDEPFDMTNAADASILRFPIFAIYRFTLSIADIVGMEAVSGTVGFDRVLAFECWF